MSNSLRLLTGSLWVIVCCGSSSASEPVDAATLQLHPIRALDAQRVADLVASIVPAERIALISATRELAVFATESAQNAVAERIAAHEKNALLLERMDLSGIDPQMVAAAIRIALRTEASDEPEKRLTRGTLKYEMDAAAQILTVAGTESQINFVKRIVAEIEKGAKDPQRSRSIADASEAAEPSRLAGDQPSRLSPDGIVARESMVEKPTTQQSTAEPRILLAPRGPVKIVHIKGLDLFLIRASGDGRSRLPAPSGDVKIEQVQGADVLLLRGRENAND